MNEKNEKMRQILQILLNLRDIIIIEKLVLSEINLAKN